MNIEEQVKTLNDKFPIITKWKNNRDNFIQNHTNIDTIKDIFKELKIIKQEVDGLFFYVSENKNSIRYDEIDTILYLVNQYHSLFGSGFVCASIISDGITGIEYNKASQINYRIYNMQKAITKGYECIIYYLDGTDLSTVNIEYKEGVNF